MGRDECMTKYKDRILHILFDALININIEKIYILLKAQFYISILKMCFYKNWALI